MKKIGLLVASLLSLFLVACSNQKSANGKLNIVTTFYPVYEFTKQVAGDTANVKLLIGAGTEPHEYEPSAKAVATIQDADAFVYENENFEKRQSKCGEGDWKNVASSWYRRGRRS